MTDAMRGTLVTLIDGTQVSSYSEEWRHECECRAIYNMPTLQKRREYLYGKLDNWGKMSGGIEQKRGKESLQRIEATLIEIWKMRKAAAAANDNQPT